MFPHAICPKVTSVAKVYVEYALFYKRQYAWVAWVVSVIASHKGLQPNCIAEGKNKALCSQ